MKPAIAVLVDGDQLGPETMPALMKRLEVDWDVTERICIRNWRSTRDQQAWREFSAEHAFRCIQRDPVATGKNAADIELAVTAMDLMHGLGYRAFCLVSGDMDFTPLVQRLKRGGCIVEWVRPEELTLGQPSRGRTGTRSRPARRSSRSSNTKSEPARPAPSTPSRPAPTTPSKPAPSKPAPPKPAAQAKQPAKPAARSPRGGKPDAAGFAKEVRRAIETVRRRGDHERGWVSVNRLGSVLTEQGSRKEDFGFPKRRSLREVLEDIGFNVEQLETGAYRITTE